MIGLKTGGGHHLCINSSLFFLTEESRVVALAQRREYVKAMEKVLWKLG